jgi:hypothetical protein
VLDASPPAQRPAPAGEILESKVGTDEDELVLSLDPL